MQTIAYTNWLTANQRYLTAALAVVRSAVARSVGLSDWVEDEGQLRRSLQEAKTALPALSALERMSRLFGLSPFEQDVLLLCAGMELDTRFVRLCALTQADPQRAYPTFSLALSALPNPHWDALTPTAALRHHHLIEVGQGTALTLSPLRIDERILHYLTGTQYLDMRLFSLVERLHESDDLVPSQQRQVEQIEAVLSDGLRAEPPLMIQLCGSETRVKRSLAVQTCERLHLKLWRISAQAVPTLPVELEQFCRLWARETLLNASVLLLDCDQIESDSASFSRLTQLIERVPSLLFLSCRERLPLPQRPVMHLEVHKPTAAEQRLTWQTALPAGLSFEQSHPIQALVSQFNLNTTTIHAICSEIKASAHQPCFQSLWNACRMQARPRLDELAQRIEPSADWQDLVLPAAQMQILQAAAAHVGQRSRVYEQWGFAAKGNRGLGISALFAGASGTGKTLAAEVLSQRLRLDLYRVDLSSVVSKYIGETEKNLRRVFDAATEGGVILLFDEADALFGKRSEVKDSRDRYANIEVSYLLQRMECYPGLAILTTNLKSALDTAFLRRIRFVVQFPFPDAIQRAEIWRRIFPAATPTQDLDPIKLAQLNIAGGNIRNVALNAAFLAADAGEPVQMQHILQAARTEYAKLEKTLTESEIGGWG